MMRPLVLLALLFSCLHLTPHVPPNASGQLVEVDANAVPAPPFETRMFVAMDALAERQPGRVRVPRKNTPITVTELMMVLHDGHVEIFGYPPGRRRLAGALAQVRAENGNGQKVYNHNLGNIGLAPKMRAAFYHYGAGIFLVFPDFVAGARAYWKTVQKCTMALAAFEQFDPTRAAHAFHRCGYHTTPPTEYASVLRPLYWSSYKMLEAP